MFKTSTPNPYDDIVVKATDENLTAENWELILTLCDKVTDEGESGARNVIAAVVKRLAHRNPNVQLYALALSESLTKNCGVELHREVASKSFTQALEKIITDRTTHDKVKKRALGLIAMWAAEFENNASLGLIEELYTSLKAKGYKFNLPDEAPPVKVDDDLRRREEEELQRALEMSMRDKGGRDQWSNYLASSNEAGGSGSGSTSALHAVQLTAQRAQTTAEPPHQQNGSAATTTPDTYTATQSGPYGHSIPEQSSPPTQPAPIPATSPQNVPVTRVRALHKFQASEPGELAFEKGEVIKVVDRIYKDWWRGQLRGRTGIFPVNYVEPLPDLTPAELAKEGEQEAAIFAQAVNIDKLLTMLRELDLEKDNLADNEEIQELYRASMALRPKIVKLIDRYNQKKAELVTMNDTFIKAKTIFDRMMEESLSRHTAEFSRPYGPEHVSPRQTAVWNATNYDQGPGYPQQFRQSMYGPQQFPPQSQATPGPGAYPPNLYLQTSHSPAPFTPPTLGVHAQTQAAAMPTQIQGGQQGPTINGYGDQSQYRDPQLVSQEPVEDTQAEVSQQNVPPYDYDPNGQYPDPNATAWARYYAQGGKDLQGAVYFKSIPGIKEPATNVDPTTEPLSSAPVGAHYQPQIDPSQAQQWQQGPANAIQDTQLNAQSPHSPTNQVQPPQGYRISSYGEVPYPQSGGTTHPNPYEYQAAAQQC